MPIPSMLLHRSNALHQPNALRQQAFDVLLAVAVGLLCWLAAVEQTPGSHEPAWLALLVGILLGAPLAMRRRWPVSTAAVVVATASASVATGLIPDYASPAPIVAAGIALYTVAATVPGRRGMITQVAGIAAVAAGSALTSGSVDGPGRSAVPFVVLVLGACGMVGWALRERRAEAARATARATAQAVTDERLRIAREIHDVVGHSLTVIAVKSAIGSHVAAQRPEEVYAALKVIAATSRSALAELRRAVGVLRTEVDFAPTPTPAPTPTSTPASTPTPASTLTPADPLTPIPTLAELGRLADQATEAGVPVQLDVSGDHDVPEGIALAAYRIVQESLTNVVKHAGPTTCRIDIVNVPGELRIEVTNDALHGGPRLGPPAGDGAGLTGMRERVALHRGALVAGPGEHGGFSVLATLPYESSQPAERPA